MKKNLYKVRICLFIMLLMYSCSSKPFPLLTDQTCVPPCWHHITPGKTTKQELLSILRELPGVESKSIWMKGESWNEFSDVVGFSLLPKIEVEVYILDDKVAMMSFFGELGVPLGEIVDQLGEPEKLLILHTMGPAPIFGDIMHTIILMLNPQKGISYGYDTLDVPRAWRSEIRPEIKVSLMDFFDPGAFQQLLESEMFSMGNLDADGTLRKMQPWIGFGKIPDTEK